MAMVDLRTAGGSPGHARPGAAAGQIAVARRCHATALLELPIEVGDVRIADLETDVGDGRGGVGQQLAGLGYTQDRDVVREGIAGVLLEEPRERGLAHADDRSDVAERNLSVEVL